MNWFNCWTIKIWNIDSKNKWIHKNQQIIITTKQQKNVWNLIKFLIDIKCKAIKLRLIKSFEYV